MNPQVAIGQWSDAPVPRYWLATRARRGARLAGAMQGLVLGVVPFAIGERYVTDDDYSEAGLISIGLVALGALVAAWVVSYVLARIFRVGRAGAVTWVSLGITTGTAVIIGVLMAVAAVAAVLFGVMVTWSGLLYRPSIVVAVVVTILIPTLVGALVTPALARVMNGRRAEQVERMEPTVRAGVPAIRI